MMDEQRPEASSAESVNNAGTEQAQPQEPLVVQAASEETVAAATAVPASSDTGTAPTAPEAAVLPAEPAVTGETEGLSELTLGSGLPAEAELGQFALARMLRGKIDRFGVAVGTGRRKTSVARVRIQDGTGQLSINGRSLEEYFHTDQNRRCVLAPLQTTDRAGKVDVWVRVVGGGTTGQAGAIALGIARALQIKTPELHEVLSTGGYLTRDGRMVERKKYGYRKARRSFQFSKR